MKSDVWSLGTTLLELMGIRPYYWNNYRRLPTKNGYFESPFDEDDIESKELSCFLEKCFEEIEERSSVNELVNVSVMRWEIMNSVYL